MNVVAWVSSPKPTKKNYIDIMFSFIWQILTSIILVTILGFGLFYLGKLFLGA